MPIHEPGLDDLVATHAGTNLRATTDDEAVLETDGTFLALPTPTSEDGGIDPSILETATESLGEVLADKEDTHLVVVKSTVGPGTTENVVEPLLERTSGKRLGEDLLVAMNPEFLREGPPSRASDTPTRSSSG